MTSTQRTNLKKKMQSSGERSFILSMLLLPFLIFFPLLLFVFGKSSPPVIESQSAPSPSPSILVTEQPKKENPTTTKRQRHMATQNNTSTFINPRNYHVPSSSSFQPVAYQAQRGSFIPPRQNCDKGASSHGTSSGNSSFQPLAYHQAQTPSFLKDPRQNYHRTARTSSSLFPINNGQNRHHGATPGRTTSFQNIYITDYNNNNNNNNNGTKTIIIPPPAKKEERREEDDVQFPNMLDIYSSLPPISTFLPSTPLKEENWTSQDTTSTTAALAPQKYILPITRVVPPTATTGFLEHNYHFAAGMHAPCSSRNANPCFVARR